MYISCFPRFYWLLWYDNNKTNQRYALVEVKTLMQLVTDYLPETNNEFQALSITLLCRRFFIFFKLHITLTVVSKCVFLFYLSFNTMSDMYANTKGGFLHLSKVHSTKNNCVLCSKSS